MEIEKGFCIGNESEQEIVVSFTSLDDAYRATVLLWHLADSTNASVAKSDWKSETSPTNAVYADQDQGIWSTISENSDQSFLIRVASLDSRSISALIKVWKRANFGAQKSQELKVGLLPKFRKTSKPVMKEEAVEFKVA